MHRTKSHLPAMLAAILIAGFVGQTAGAQMPIPSAGVIPDVAGATDRPDPARAYKLAFDVKSMGSSDAVNPALTGIARVINTLRQQGVPADHIQATAVFHGPTIVLVTKNETYRNRTGAKANPNLALLRDLASAGVKIVICGVSAAEQNYTKADLVPEATMNMSATLTFIDLGMKGYVKVER